MSHPVDVVHGESDFRDQVRENLRSSAQHEWYDGTSGKLTRPTLRSASPPNEPRDWTLKPSQRVTSGGRAWSGSSGNDWIWPVLFATVVMLILGTIYFLRTVGRAGSSRSSIPDRTRDPQLQARAEELPFELPRTGEGVLEMARRLAIEGRFGEATVALYGFQLLMLDRVQRIRLAKGKTNRQYVRELRQAEPFTSILSETMVAFERFVFGGHLTTSATFYGVWNRVEEFETKLAAEAGTNDAK